MTRSALITQRRVRKARTLLVVIAPISFAALIFGFILGLTMPRDYKCPQVPGAKVITTSDSHNGQYCVYADDNYGKAKVRVKL